MVGAWGCHQMPGSQLTKEAVHLRGRKMVLGQLVAHWEKQAGWPNSRWSKDLNTNNKPH